MVIHPTAIIDPTADIDPTAQIGPYCVIGQNVVIGAKTTLSSHVVIAKDTMIGNNNQIYQFASLGDDPQDLKYQGEATKLIIGDNNIIREACSFHRGTIQGNGTTVIGNHNLFMVNTHIAHDCVVGDYNILANNAGVAGHVHIGDYVVVGGNAGIHQFCRLDSYSMVGASSYISKDVVAFVLVAGNSAKAKGINKEGLNRKGWAKTTIDVIEQAYKLIFRSGLTTSQAVQALKPLVNDEPKVQLMIDSLMNSKRGIVR